MRPSADSSRGRKSQRLALAIFVLVAGVLVIVGVVAARGDTAPQSTGAVTQTAGTSLEAGHQASVTSGTVRGPATVTTAPLSPSSGDAVRLPASLPADGPTVHLPILMYHYVADAPPTEMGPYAASLTVLTEEFEAQAAYLEAKGVATVDFTQVYLALAGSSPLPRPSVLITFDDGGADLYTYAFPILEKHGLTATFFVITNEIGKPGYLTWEQLAEMRAAGMSIQSHTVSHPDLPATDGDRLQNELAESKRAIEQSLGQQVLALCYPAGSYDLRVQNAAREAGYLLAVTTEPGTNCSPAAPLALPRVRIQTGLSSTGFAQLVE